MNNITQLNTLTQRANPGIQHVLTKSQTCYKLHSTALFLIYENQCLSIRPVTSQRERDIQDYHSSCTQSKTAENLNSTVAIQENDRVDMTLGKKKKHKKCDYLAKPVDDKDSSKSTRIPGALLRLHLACRQPWDYLRVNALNPTIHPQLFRVAG